MAKFIVTVKQNVKKITDSEDIDYFDTDHGINQTFEFNADDEDEALDLFHNSIPISLLEEFDIWADLVPGEIVEPIKEFAFDVELRAVIRVMARTARRARQILEYEVNEAYYEMLPDHVKLTEFSLDLNVFEPDLFEIDGMEIT